MKKFVSCLLFIVCLFCCGSAFGYERDWVKFPAFVEIKDASRVCAVGDIHGAFDELADTLFAMHVAKRSSPKEFKLEWVGKDTVLVFVGDFCDRGAYTKQVYDALMSLEQQALKAGGRVIAVLGNHEVYLMRGDIKPPNSKYYQNGQQPEKRFAVKSSQQKKSFEKIKKGFLQTVNSFERDGLNFEDAIAETGLYGKYVRNMPLFAIVNGFLFSHGGLPSKPVTRLELAEQFQRAITAGNWKKGILGDKKGIIFNRKWWKHDELVDANLKALGVQGVVFGHTPGALGPKGKIIAKDNRLVSVDIGMTPSYGYSKGGGIVITKSEAGHLIFRAIYPNMPEELLFSVKICEQKPTPAAAAGGL